MKKILAYVMLALIASLWGCSDMGDRDNPTDPSADNYDASLVPGDGNGGGDEPGDGGEGDDGKGSSSSNGISSNSSSSKGSSSSVTPKSSDSETSVSTGTMTDSRDGQTYKTVKIGDQVWMAQNLNYKSDNSYCYNDSAKYCSEYGRLYTWADAMESCPTGWHLPSKDEFVILANIAGGSSKAGKPLMAKDGWNSNGGGYDTYSFAALPGGARNEDGEYVLLGEQGSFWLASEDAFRFVANNLPLYIAPNNRGRGLSVRCLKDAGQSLSSSSQSGVNSSSSGKVSVELGTFTDERDGQTYKTVKIGDQVWMAQNLNYKSDNSYCYNDSAKYCSEYGRLYTWADAMESCPTGWHLPSKDEFVILANIAGGSSKAGKPLMAKDGWNSNGGGYDTYSFAALPGGARNEDGEYVLLGEQGSFWLASEDAFRFVANNLPLYIAPNNRGRGLSVRCLKDAGQSLSSSSQSGVNSSSSGKVSVELGTFTDERDEQTYKTVKIGDQVWMAQNLNFKTDSSFCYNDEEANCTKYGRHYKWAAAVGKSESECGYGNECSLPSGDIQGACPSGWHLPSKTEWETLFTTVGGNSTAGKVLKSASGWNNSGNGTDAFEFTVLPAGGRYGSGNYSNEGKSAIFWSSTEFKDKDAYIVSLFYDGGAPYLSYAEKRYGYSVRCLMDTEQPSSSSSAISVLPPCKTADSDDCEYGTFTDERDGHTYKTVKIGDQEWMAENLNFDYNVGSAKSYCYDQSELNCDKYGRLYTWAAAMDSSAAFSNSAAGCGYLVDCSLSYPVRGVCPEGWILPDSTDMVKLIKAVGNYSVAGGTLRSVSQGGTDGYGFNFMMAGMRNNSGNYVNKDAIGYLWMSHPRGRYNADHILFEKVESARYYNNYRYNSFSVRCLKN